MSTKDIEKENRLKAQSDKSYQELKEAMSNVKKAIHEAQTLMKRIIDEARREIKLEVERYLIEKRNKILQLEETNIEVNRIELSLEKNEMMSYSGTPTTTDYKCTEINNVDISEQLVIEEQINLIEENMNDCDIDYSDNEDNMTDLDDFESFNIINESEDSFSFDAKFSESSIMNDQSELEIVNDIELDWDENIVFNHANIQPSKVKCLPLCSKNSCISQQGLKTMKFVASDVEVSSANVLSDETESNSCVQFEEGLPRKIWDPGLYNILL